MRIKIADTWITGDSGRQRPSNFRVNGRTIEQEAQFLRATQARIFNRGNALTTVTFDIAQEHDSILIAQEFMLLHYVNLPKSGTALFVLEASAGNQKKLYMANAGISAIAGECVGLSSLISYTIRGGIPTEAPPE